MATVRQVMQRKGKMRKFVRSHNLTSVLTASSWAAYNLLWTHWGGREIAVLKAVQKALHFPENGLWGPKEQHWFYPPSIIIRYKPLSFISSLPSRLQSEAMIFHTNDGGPDVSGYWENQHKKDGSRICAHFQVFRDGRIEQYVPTSKQAFAAYSSNSFAIQVETEDDNNPEQPWTDAQVDAIIQLARKYHIPGRLLRVYASNGVGWHCQYKQWNLSNHSCPCPAKISQIHDRIIPAL